MRESSATAFTIVGAGACTREELRLAMSVAPGLVAADGGAARITSEGLQATSVIGDFDSLPRSLLPSLGDTRLQQVGEQDTTDFDKCVRMTEVDLLVGVGVLSPALDHALAALHVLLKYRWRKIILLRKPDICMLCPPELTLRLPADERVSLFPMAEVQGLSKGLAWPIDGIDFSPHTRVGTSNRVSTGPVRLRFSSPGMLMILSDKFLEIVAKALSQTCMWPPEEPD